VKESINSRYEDIASRKKWRWRRRQWDFKVNKKHITGTVDLVSGEREVTGTGTGWLAMHKGWWFKKNTDDDVYQIVAVDVAGQTILLSAPYVEDDAADAQYTIFQAQFGLVPDCEEIDLVRHDRLREPVEIRSPREVKELITRNPNCEGTAVLCTIEGGMTYEGPPMGEMIMGHDYMGGDEQNDLLMTIYPPIADEDYVMHLDYVVKLTALDADDDEPLIPVEKRHVLVYGALADMFSRERADETSAFWEEKFERAVRELEADVEFSDEKPKMVVDRRRWRLRRHRPDPTTADLGSLFLKI
jgi:hypothetical protein